MKKCRFCNKTFDRTDIGLKHEFICQDENKFNLKKVNFNNFTGEFKFDNILALKEGNSIKLDEYDYVFDNIRAKTNISTYSSLSGLTILNMGKGFFISSPIDLLSFKDGAVFKAMEGASVTKSFDYDNEKMIIDIDGNVCDSEFKMTLDKSFIKEMILEKIDSVKSVKTKKIIKNASLNC